MAKVNLLAVALAVVALSASNAGAQTSEARALANREAYDAAMKCFIVAGAASGERKDAGDSAKSEFYEAKARQSFDVAVKLGQTLGFTGNRINQDFGLVQARELPKLVKDQTYNRAAAATCRAIGLL